MENNPAIALSPLNLEYLKNQDLKNASQNKESIKDTNVLERNPNGDTFELQTDKKTKLSNKQKFLIAAGAAAALCIGGYATIRHKQTVDVKKMIQKDYDAIAQKAAEDMNKAGLAYEKPELVFKKIKKNTNGCYLVDENKIIFNTRYLNRKKFTAFNPKGVPAGEISENLEQCDLFPLKKNFIERFTKKSPSKAEFQMMKSTTVAHEIEHSKQWQAALHAENFNELYAEAVRKKNPNAALEEVKKSLANNSFISKFKPSKKISADTKIAFISKGEGLVTGKIDRVTFTPKEAIDYLVNYSNKGEKYFLNPLEIGARLAEYGHAANNNFEGVSEETKKAFRLVKSTNYYRLLQAKKSL